MVQVVRKGVQLAVVGGTGLAGTEPANAGNEPARAIAA
jgi:hypothetical protein